MAYIEEHGKEPGCLFCRQPAQTDGPANLILHRGQLAFVILNRFPYTSGHLMIAPFAHKASLELLDSPTLTELIALTATSLTLLRRVYGAQAFNIGVNIGEAAGAGVVDHVHVHVVPRWRGDTNFMTTTAETRVIPTSLEAAYERLLEGWQALEADR